MRTNPPLNFLNLLLSITHEGLPEANLHSPWEIVLKFLHFFYYMEKNMFSPFVIYTESQRCLHGAEDRMPPQFITHKCSFLDTQWQWREASESYYCSKFGTIFESWFPAINIPTTKNGYDMFFTNVILHNWTMCLVLRVQSSHGSDNPREPQSPQREPISQGQPGLLLETSSTLTGSVQVLSPCLWTLKERSGTGNLQLSKVAFKDSSYKINPIWKTKVIQNHSNSINSIVNMESWDARQWTDLQSQTSRVIIPWRLRDPSSISSPVFPSTS